MRPRFGRHPRLVIWGPLEARLQQADLLILGGLNEGTWPAETGGRSVAQPADAAQASACRRRNGAIGLAAHDFAAGAAARRRWC